MESVKALLDSKRILISLQYYGIQDLGTCWEVKSIVDNQDIFAELYSRFPLTAIDCLDDYYLYLLSLKFVRLQEVIPVLLQEDHKEFIAKLVGSAKKAIDDVKTGELIRYLNEHINEIFDEELLPHDIQLVTLNIIVFVNNKMQRKVPEKCSGKPARMRMIAAGV